jgi:hypothetical protein
MEANEVEIGTNLPENIKQYVDDYIRCLNFKSSKEIELLYRIIDFSYISGQLIGIRETRERYNKNI